MSSIKSRGRPTATQILEPSTTTTLISNIATTINTNSNLLQQQYVPSLLKIESVVPTRLNVSRGHQQRTTRLITRSYSTLCGPTISTPTAASNPTSLAFVNGTINYKNGTKKINSNLNRHKNHYQRLDNGFDNDSPTGKVHNQQANDTSCIVVEKGVYKVRRTTKEKEKQPDRINLDRRGLCMIPVIDNEPSLRLLSLQHNLINTFHIPSDEPCSSSIIDGAKDSNNNNVPSKEMEKSNGNNQLSSCVINSKPMKSFLKQKSVSRNQLNLNFSANNNNNNNNVNNATTLGNGVAKPNGAHTPTPFLQKSLMLQSKNGLLKRANSVMINCSPNQTSTTVQSSIFFQTQKNKLVTTPSFSMTDTHTHHETTNVSVTPRTMTPEIQVDAKINSFRFNLTNLVFLDLYNNQIEKISNLDGLKSLTVLLLGKNRISDISGITSLKQTLRVLDLHGNRITHITQKINQLQELKSLNLAGNLLRQIQPNDFSGLCCLKELNLKRNRIKKINVSDDLHNLERYAYIYVISVFI
ncbi:CLUMA_CG012552, isoform A [Clunio marinus]|uniref:Dynein axonemal assembly factor 1 homolog n=1 Tax=Clunio marinus TaxID=568069 RepID=A0A1J1II20_9DIPT|nr:CLUMA_CG012552, isoform A [Clunio marinus]